MVDDHSAGELVVRDDDHDLVSGDDLGRAKPDVIDDAVGIPHLDEVTLAYGLFDEQKHAGNDVARDVLKPQANAQQQGRGRGQDRREVEAERLDGNGGPDERKRVARHLARGERHAGGHAARKKEGPDHPGQGEAGEQRDENDGERRQQRLERQRAGREPRDRRVEPFVERVGAPTHSSQLPSMMSTRRS